LTRHRHRGPGRVAASPGGRPEAGGRAREWRAARRPARGPSLRIQSSVADPPSARPADGPGSLPDTFAAWPPTG